MLVLSRKLNEAIVIDGDIRVTVLGVSGGKVRLGIEAPGSLPVLRAELVDAAAALVYPAPLAAQRVGNASRQPLSRPSAPRKTARASAFASISLGTRTSAAKPEVRHARVRRRPPARSGAVIRAVAGAAQETAAA